MAHLENALHEAGWVCYSEVDQAGAALAQAGVLEVLKTGDLAQMLESLQDQTILKRMGLGMRKGTAPALISRQKDQTVEGQWVAVAAGNMRMLMAMWPVGWVEVVGVLDLVDHSAQGSCLLLHLHQLETMMLLPVPVEKCQALCYHL